MLVGGICVPVIMISPLLTNCLPFSSLLYFWLNSKLSVCWSDAEYLYYLHRIQEAKWHVKNVHTQMNMDFFGGGGGIPSAGPYPFSKGHFNFAMSVRFIEFQYCIPQHICILIVLFYKYFIKITITKLFRLLFNQLVEHPPPLYAGLCLASFPLTIILSLKTTLLYLKIIIE